jgi:hypothetical protein
MSDPTPEELRASIVPKSDQLNADDLLTGPVTVTIERVRKGDTKEQPVIIDISGYPGRPYKPCKTMRRILIAQFSDDPKAWIGKQMTLFNDPNVTWGGLKTGGIRISHLSGLEGPRTFLLTQTRGKKAEVTIHPIVAKLTPEDQAYVEAIKDKIAHTETLKALQDIGAELKTKPKIIGDAVRATYKQRQTALEQT